MMPPTLVCPERKRAASCRDPGGRERAGRHPAQAGGVSARCHDQRRVGHSPGDRASVLTVVRRNSLRYRDGS